MSFSLLNHIKKEKILAVFAISLIFLSVTPFQSIGYKDSDGAMWPMYRGNPSHTGRSIYSAASNPGRALWIYSTGNMVRSSPSLDANGTIYVGSDDGYLYAINRNGTLRWKFRTGGAVHSSPAITSDMVVFGSDDGYLYALSKNGNLKWKMKTNGSIWSSPTIFKESIYFGSDDGNLYCVDFQGNIEWNFTSGGAIRSSPAVSSDERIYFGSDRLYSLSSNGTLLWSFNANSEFQSSPAIGVDGTIYVGSMGGKIYAIDRDGKEFWNFPTGDSISSSPAIGADGTIYVGSRDGCLYALSHVGSLVWKKRAYGSIWWSSPTISADGLIFVGNYRGEMLSMYSNGTLKWRYRTGSAVWSSPTIGPDGTVYFGSGNGNIYALWKTVPSPPKNIKAYASSNYVNISWEAPISDGGSPVTEYRIYRGPSAGDEEFIASVPPWKTFYIDHTRRGGRYYYYIIAVNDIGSSERSDEIRPEIIKTLSPPTELSYRIEGNRVNITWKPSEASDIPVKEYMVFRGEEHGHEDYIGSTNRTYFIDRNVSAGKTYYYYIKAVNDLGESEKSEELEVNLKEAPPILLYVSIGLAGIGALLLFLRWKRWLF